MPIIIAITIPDAHIGNETARRRIISALNSPERQGAVKGLLDFLSTEDDPPLGITVLDPAVDLTPEGQGRV
jgi:hypothetical protein